MKILLVDDSSTMRRIQKNVLNQLGYADVDEAGDGLEGLEKMKGNQYGLVLADWNMPNMDGITMVREIRANAAWAKIPILMVTTEAEKSRIMEAIKAGVQNYVVKPFTPDVLSEKIKSVL